MKHINLIGKLIINSMLLLLLWAILALPASSFSLIKYQDNSVVLSEQDVRDYDGTADEVQINNGRR